MGASRLLRGGAGDLQLRLSDGATVWCGEHHVSLMDDTDALAVGGERADATANDASNTAAEVSDAPGLEQADVNTPIVSDDELSDASHASRDSSEGARARVEQQQEIDEKRAQRQAAAAWAADPQRHTVMRAHIDYIVAHNLCPAEDGRFGKQKDLAEKIRVGHKRLSEYKTGIGRRGILTACDLAVRRTEIVGGLMRVGLPAADDSAAGSSADQVRSACGMIRCDCDVIAM
jgi:hypothetical protein